MIKTSIECLCNNNVLIEYSENIDLSENPEISEDIIAGTFLSVTCDKCGKQIKPEFQIRFFNPDNNFDLCFIPELDRDQFLLGKKKCQAKRIVIGYPELSEKMTIIKADLDDRILEIIKFFILGKLSSKENIFIYFEKLENEILFFHIHGLKKDEIGVSKIKLEIYKKIEKELPERMQEAIFKEITTEPYVSINKLSPDEEE